MRYTFEWDPVKAKVNVRKHGVTFERAAEVFLDPLAISILDQKHAESEDRWITVGLDSLGTAIVLVHTFDEVRAAECKIRLISARKATKRELRQYEESER